MTEPATDPKKPARGMRGVIELVITVVVALAIAYLIEALFVKPYRIPSASMYPTLHEGQRILVNRLSTDPGLGDIVVFHPPAGATDTTIPPCADPNQGPGHPQPCSDATTAVSSETFVKRVVGLPGDTLVIRNGYVYRNGHKETGSYIQPCPDQQLCTFPAPITVPRGEYYMMGDNRDESDDSRFWGPVRQNQIIGTAFFTYWPPDRIGFL
jgi:signal peptidase I